MALKHVAKEIREYIDANPENEEIILRSGKPGRFVPALTGLFPKKGIPWGSVSRNPQQTLAAGYFFLSFIAASAISGRRIDSQSGSDPLILPFLFNVCQFSLRSSISIGFMGIV